MNSRRVLVRKVSIQCKKGRRSLSLSAPCLNSPHQWRPSMALDEWVKREARPISLSQMMFYKRKLTKERLLQAANYVREELPTRIAHRLRDMQTLPYKVVTNQHWLHVYKLYESAFDRFRRVPIVRTIEDNDAFCKVIDEMLKQHLTVIPSLIIGVIEVRNLIDVTKLDSFTSTMLRSRISRRILAEQHISLTETFRQTSKSGTNRQSEYVGDILRLLNANEIVQKCADYTRKLMIQSYGPNCKVPEVNIRGDLSTAFPYPVAHLEYIVGELLRNSIQAAIENSTNLDESPKPIDVLICQNPQQAIIRICDQAGGISQPILDHLWSFCQGPNQANRLKNLNKVPKLAATMADMEPLGDLDKEHHQSSLSSLSTRPPDLRLGIGLPMSRIYAEFWAGNLAIHSLEGYGTDAFLGISKLGNKNEHITTRATIDAV